MYSAYKLNKQGDNTQPWHTPFPICSQSVVPCPVLNVVSWPAYRFLRRQVRWSGTPIALRIVHNLWWSIHIWKFRVHRNGTTTIQFSQSQMDFLFVLFLFNHKASCWEKPVLLKCNTVLFFSEGKCIKTLKWSTRSFHQNNNMNFTSQSSIMCKNH